MAALNGKPNTNRQSYFLSVKPIEYSLTEGTNIPPPSPSKSPLEPPAAGGGPLTSHPATPPNGEVHRPVQPAVMPEEESTRDRSDSFRTPTSPASNAQYSSSPQDRRRPGGVRRLFSLTNLRSSFSSSRTSLSQPRASHDTYNQQHPYEAQSSGTKRPSSPSMASTAATSSLAPASTLRSKKSGGNWFKRKSGFFNLDNNGELEVVQENQRPDTRESKRLKESSPAPLLPEIGSLGGGGGVGGGDLGWDEQAFKR